MNKNLIIATMISISLFVASGSVYAREHYEQGKHEQKEKQEKQEKHEK